MKTLITLAISIFSLCCVGWISKTSICNSSILKKMSKKDGKHKLVHQFLGYGVCVQLRGSEKPQGTKCHIFVGGPELQYSDRHIGVFLLLIFL